jgi:molybdopterin-guanine dinucleotide biosynthesis protein A
MSHYSHAVIFAGGQSSRMGKDKALLPFGKDTTLTAYQYEKLKKVFHTVSISAKENKFNFDCPVIIDIYKESSPLVGILSIFETLQDVDEVFILSVDAPFVNDTIIAQIMEKNTKTADVIVAKSPNGIQPLCGLYKRSILALAHKQYEKNNHKLQDLLALAKTENVLFEENTPFTNLNHPEEYEEALKLSL